MEIHNSNIQITTIHVYNNATKFELNQLNKSFAIISTSPKNVVSRKARLEKCGQKLVICSPSCNKDHTHICSVADVYNTLYIISTVVYYKTK